jgi:hypothetical protein
MVSAVSSASTAVTATPASSSSDNTAKLKTQLADKQSQLSQAKTDQEKAQLNAEITQLKAEISAAQTTGSSSNSSAANASSRTHKWDEAKLKGAFNTADKAAPESKMSSANMDVLMRMGQKGGMMPPGGPGMGGPQDLSKMYTNMDGDDDGKVTKDEFVSANADHMGKDQAAKVYDEIDTQNTGSITEDQFVQSVKQHDRGGSAWMGPQGGDVPAWNGSWDGQADDTNSDDSTPAVAA